MTSTADSGPGTLRAALGSAANGDTINFSLTYPATITLTSGPLTIGTSLAISGPGAANLFISGNNATTVFLVNGVTATISGITIENGNAGGGWRRNQQRWNADGEQLHLLRQLRQRLRRWRHLQQWHADGEQQHLLRQFRRPRMGGGIDNIATATIINSTFSNNSAVINGQVGGQGGGVFDGGTMTLVNDTFSGNSANTAQGGGAPSGTNTAS